MRKILYITYCLSLCLAVGCSSSGGGDDTPAPPPPTGGNDDGPTITDPSAATLVFPANNTECNTGIVDPNDETVSTVTFEWNASANTDRYTVNITNLNSGTTGFSNSNTNSVDITILRGVPYEWWVTSRATGTTATADSERFRFYNEGPGLENYAPFPAVAVSPARGVNLDASTTTVNLDWEASDVDDDITGYEVFFGTDANPTTSIGTPTESSLADVAVASGSTYYWMVVTTDSQGNTSNSEIFTFRVN